MGGEASAERRGRRRWRTVGGVLASVVYLALVSGWVCYTWPALRDLPLSQLGDFLAGTFAPLAFLWLVLGYLQQGDELQLNTEALEAQQRELALQVAETARLVEAASKQAAAAEAAALEARRANEAARTPRLILRMVKQTETTAKLHLSNHGGAAVDAFVTMMTGGSVVAHPPPSLPSGQGADIRLNAPQTTLTRFRIGYSDIDGIRYVQEYELTAPAGLALIREGKEDSAPQ